MDHGNGSIVAILIGVWATFALDVFSTLNSSPQTTELFAEDRQDTLMHWVKIGDTVALVGGGTAAIVSRKVWPLIGAALVVVMMHVLYKHAVKRGVGVPPPEAASSDG